MSRIGKMPISFPGSVTVEVDQKENAVLVKGPKGSLRKSFDPAVSITLEDGHLSVMPVGKSRFALAMWGTARSIIGAMVQGVLTPFEKKLEIFGVGFRAELKGGILVLNLGRSHPNIYNIPEGVSVVVTDSTKITISGCDKQVVGQAMASIYAFSPVEPFKGKGVRIVGRPVRRKEGKKAA